MTTKIIKNLKLDKINEFIKRLEYLDTHALYVGVPSSENSRGEGTSNAMIAAAHEFGAMIEHPGGTRYQSHGKKSKFISNSFIGPTSGVTGPYTIVLPERSFIRSTLKENQDKYLKIDEQQIKASLAGGIRPEVFLNKKGLMVAGDIKQKISSGDFTPLKEATIKRKGSSKPLNDTRQLTQSITYEIRKDV